MKNTKVKEWESWFNSFNSAKGLLYAPWYQAIKEWKDGKRLAPLPPVEASLDPINVCNLNCSHCNASRYLLHPPKDRMIRMPDEHYLELVKFLGNWGVKAICHGGGGEPTMHTALGEAMITAQKYGMENSIATNGINFNEELIDIAVNTCRWVGVSVDSATPKTYKVGRGADRFSDTIGNIEKLCDAVDEFKTNCDIAFKFLVFEYNQNEIYEACKLAKELGVKDFHARPADLSHQGMDEQYKGTAQPYSIDLVKEQFEKCHDLEDDNFHVYTIVHKFDENFIPRKDFSQCYASPCCLQICPDGSLFLCPDQRYKDFFKLGEHYPDVTEIKRVWGSRRHYDLVFNSGRKACSTRCTFNTYCKQAEELFMNDNDPMCKNFI